MGLRGVNRVMIAVHDLEKAKRQYVDLLGATFVDEHWTGEPWGITVSIAWDAGIELCAPLPGMEKDSAVSHGKSKTCVWRWQERFTTEGVDVLLRDKTRPPGIAPLGGHRIIWT